MNQKKPRILIFNHGLRLGGVERSLIGMLRCMDPARVQVDLLLLEASGELMSQVPTWVNILPVPKEHNDLIMPIRFASCRGRIPIFLARLAARTVIYLRKLIGLPEGFLLARSHRYAMPFIPHVPGEYDLAISYLTPHDLVAKKVRARRKAGWIHTDYTSIETGVAIRFEIKAWDKMDRIVSISSDVTASTTKVFPQLAPKIVEIENILDPRWVREKSLAFIPSAKVDWPPPPVLRFCSVGRLTHQKGFDIAIKSASKLKSTGLDFRWYVIGYGPDEAMLTQQIEDAGLRGTFILLGAHENPYPFIRHCDLYIQPSRYEGKAVSIREAQMLGKPVLASDFATVRSQIAHGVDGFVTPAGPEGLTDGILKLVNDPALRAKLSAESAAKDYGNLSEVDKVMALIPRFDV